MYEPLQTLRAFGVRSRVVYVLIVVTSVLALGSAFLLPGQVGVVSFVAFLNFAAGLWIAQLVHSLGYTVAGEPRPIAEASAPATVGLFEEIAWERFIRIAVVVAAGATVFVFTATEILSPEISTIALGAIGAVALLAAMIAFLIAAASTLNHEGRSTTMGADERVRERSGDDEVIASEKR